MRNVKFFSVITCLVLAFILAFSAVHATERIKGPDGNFISQVEVFNEKGVDYKLLTTNYVVYSSHFIPATGWSKAKKLFTFSSEGGSITDMTLKNRETGNVRHCYIMLNDGTVYEFTFDVVTDIFGENPAIEKPSTEILNYSSIKILVSSSYYLNASGRLFINKRDGKGWIRDSVFSSKNITSFCLDKDDVLFLASSRIFKQSSEIGQFEKINSIDTSSSFITIYYSPDDILYAHNQLGNLFYSADGGITWTAEQENLKIQIAKISKDAKGTIYAYGNSGNMNSLYRKQSGGSWEKIDTNLLHSTGYKLDYCYDFGCINTLELETRYGSFSSYDMGETWVESNSGIDAESIASGLFLKNGTMVATTDAGIFKRTSLVSDWVKIYPKSGNPQTNLKICKDGIDNLYLANAASSSGFIVYKSTDEGESWNPDTLGVYVLPQKNSVSPIFYVDQNGGQHVAYRSVNSKSTMIAYSRTPTTPWGLDTNGFNLGGLWLISTSVGAFGSDNKYLYFSGYYSTNSDHFYVVFKRDIGGTDWTLDTAGTNNIMVSRFLADKNDIMHSGIINNKGNYDILKHEEKNWKALNLQVPINYNFMTTFGFDSSNTLFTAYRITSSLNFKESLYATSDDGKTWLTGGMGKKYINEIAVWKDSVYAFSNSGIYLVTTKPAKFPKLKLDIDSINFGKLPTYKQKDTTISISNIGEDTLFLSRYTTSEVFFMKEDKVVIPPGETKNLNFYFKPLYIEKEISFYEIISNDFTRYIILTGEGILTDSSAKYVLNKDTVDFGTVATTTQKDTTFVIHNTGLDTLHVNSVGSYASGIGSLQSKFKVPPGGKYLDTIRFKPTSNGLIKGYLVIRSNILPDTIFVKGTGWTKPKPKLQFSKPLIDFGNVTVGSVKDTFFLISNTSADSIQISDFVSSSNCFSITPSKMKMKPTTNMIFYPEFRPTEIKSYEAFFEIIANDLPDTIFVKGAGVKGTGIIENSTGNDLVLSPNPAEDFIEISVGAQGTVPNIRIFNVFGKEILKSSDLNNSQFTILNSQLRIDVSCLPSGVYFVRVGNIVGKFVKI